MLDVLAIGAHPDDAELAAGATLAAFARRGARVGLLHLTRGEAATRGSPETRAVEAEAAAERLGARFLRILDLGDGRLADSEGARVQVVAVLRETRPRLVIGPWIHDDHPDHAAAGHLVKAARMLAGVANYAPHAGAAHRPTQLWHFMQHEAIPYTFVAQVTEADAEAKLEAIRAYRSQFHDPTSTAPVTRIARPEFLEAITARLRVYGSFAGFDLGEPFTCAGPLPVADPAALLA